MTYPQTQPPYVPGSMPPPGDWRPPAPKSKAVPLLIGLVVVLLLAVAGLAYALLRVDGPAASPKTLGASNTAVFTRIQQSCSTVAGYRIEDDGRTLVLAVGGPYMNTSTMNCVFDQLSVPGAVREHLGTTRALDGQQTDSWPGYTARWTYHPDDGIQMTIQMT